MNETATFLCTHGILVIHSLRALMETTQERTMAYVQKTAAQAEPREFCDTFWQRYIGSVRFSEKQNNGYLTLTTGTKR